MSSVPTPGFDPIKAYDAPEVIIANILDGNFSPDMVSNVATEALGGPPTLGIGERKDLDDLFGPIENPIVRTAVNVATNPFSYLMFLGGIPAGKIAGGLFRVAPKYSAAVMDRAPFLHTVGAATGRHLTRGTPLSHFVDDFNHGLEEWFGALQGTTKGGMDKLINTVEETHGIRIHPEDMTNLDRLTGKKREIVEEINNLITVRLRGFNKDRKEYLFKEVDGVFKAAPRDLKKIVNVSDEEITRRLSDYGADELLDSMMESRKKAFELLFLDANGAVDPQKVARVHSSRRFRNAESMKNQPRGDNAIGQLFGRELEEAIEEGLDSDTFLNIVRDTYGQVLKGNAEFYVPRNTFRIADRVVDGRIIENTAKARAYRSGDSVIQVGRSLKGRQQTVHEMDPEDLRSLRTTFAGQVDDAIFDTLERKAYDAVDAVAGTSNTAWLERLRPFEAMDRYYNTAGRTYANYVRPPSKAALLMQKESLQKLRESEFKEKILGRGGSLRGRKGLLDEGDDLLTAFSDAENVPPGGFTVADGVDQSYRLIPETNEPARKYIAEMLVPSMSGRASVKDVAGIAAGRFMQGIAKGFMDTDIGKAFRESDSAPLRNLGRALDDFITKEPDFTRSFSGGTARWLYTSHLGLNMGSVLQNLSQPIVTTARWVKGPDMVEGYKRATQQYLSYVEDRLKHPFHIDARQQEVLHRKHFRLFDQLGLSKNSAFEMLDASLQRSGMFTGASGRFGSVNRFQQNMMRPFQNAEIVNRLVTAEAIAARNLRLGGRLDDPRVLAEITQGVQESQFGAGILNTPSSFLSRGNPLSNPILKQFLQFPTRMLVSPFEVGAVANENPVAAFGILRDVARGVGITTVGYEAFKAWDIDVSRMGFLESTTQLGGAFVDDRDGPIPIPPAIQIASETSKWMTGQDNQFFKYTLPRVIPGGLAFSRATQALPELSTMVGLSEGTLSDYTPQRRYTDWTKLDANGEVPVFDANGNFLAREKGTTQLMRGIGLDLTGFQNEAQLEQFLLQQSEQVGTFKTELKRLVRTHNYSEAKNLQEKFRSKFGYELKLSRSDMRNMQRMREVPRTERILNRTPNELRPDLAAIVFDERGPDDLNFMGTREQFIQAANARAREDLRKFQQRIDPKQIPAQFLENQ